MVKARLLVEGTVQGTGYRALVKSYANRRGVIGIARNLPDGSVEIFVEGPKDKIEQLIRDINVKGLPSNPLSLDVERVTTYWEGEGKYQDPPRSPVGFEIDYGAEKLTPFEKENLDSLEWAKLRFSMLENGIYSFRDETQVNFSTMANKYDAISTDVKGTKQELTASLDKLPDRIGESLTRHLKKLIK